MSRAPSDFKKKTKQQQAKQAKESKETVVYLLGILCVSEQRNGRSLGLFMLHIGSVGAYGKGTAFRAS